MTEGPKGPLNGLMDEPMGLSALGFDGRIRDAGSYDRSIDRCWDRRIERGATLQRLLVAVDGSADSAATVDYACDLAEACGASIEIVEAVENVDVFPLGPATTVLIASTHSVCIRRWLQPG